MKGLTLSLAVILLSCFGHNCNAQSEDRLHESSIWLKPKNTENPDLAAKKENIAAQTLNFILPLNFQESEIPQKYSSVITKQSSLFVVFKAAEDNDEELLKLQVGTFKTFLTNKKLIHDKEEELNKFNPVLGNIVSHIFNRNSIISRKKGSLTFNDLLYFDLEGKNKLYEIVYIPRAVNEKEQAIIESYLSVKYGVSQLPDKNYLNSAGDTIWDFKQNRDFGFRVTGIGRDSGTKLYQKQSGNNTKDGLYIGLDKITGLNSNNKGIIADKVYLLWGDNDLETKLEEHTAEGYVKMNRLWKAVKTAPPAQNLNTQVVINKKQMAIARKPEDKGFIWLVRDTVSTGRIDYAKAIYTKASFENDSLVVFDKVKWTSQHTLFSFVTGPDFIVQYELTAPSCSAQASDGKINIRITEGAGPFAIRLSSAGFYKELVSDEDSVTIEGLVSGQYTLEVTDRNKIQYKGNFAVDPFVNTVISLEPVYVLEKGSAVTITPVTDDSTAFKYSWRQEDKVVSTEKQYVADTPGNYKLAVSNSEGCEKILPFSITEKDAAMADGYKIYPNPCKNLEPFTIEFGLLKESKASVLITDLNGKVIISEDLGLIKRHIYNNRISTSATYIVIVTIDGVQSSSKLIIL